MPTAKERSQALAKIVMDCQRPGYKLYVFKRNADWMRSYQIRALFHDRYSIKADEVAAVFKEMEVLDYSLESEAKRGGEIIRWGVDNGIITRVPGARPATWTITDEERVPLYEEYGSYGHRRVIRMRRWRTPEEEKAFHQEMKRLEKKRQKEVAELKVYVEGRLAELLARDIEVEARGDLLPYTLPGTSKLVEIQGFLLQSIDDMSRVEAYAVRNCFRYGYNDIDALPLAIAITEDTDDADLDILSDFAEDRS